MTSVPRAHDHSARNDHESWVSSCSTEQVGIHLFSFHMEITEETSLGAVKQMARTFVACGSLELVSSHRDPVTAGDVRRIPFQVDHRCAGSLSFFFLFFFFSLSLCRFSQRRYWLLLLFLLFVSAKQGPFVSARCQQQFAGQKAWSIKACGKNVYWLLTIRPPNNSQQLKEGSGMHRHSDDCCLCSYFFLVPCPLSTKRRQEESKPLPYQSLCGWWWRRHRKHIASLRPDGPENKPILYMLLIFLIS